MHKAQHALVFVSFLLLGLILIGCTSKTPLSNSQPETNNYADGYDILGKTWSASGVYFNNTLYSLEDVGLETLYGDEYLFFYENGTYTYFFGYFQEGFYKKKTYDSFLLTDERGYHLDFVDGKAVEVESTDETNMPFLLTVIDSGKALRLERMDPVTGKGLVGDIPLYFTPTE